MRDVGHPSREPRAEAAAAHRTRTHPDSPGPASATVRKGNVRGVEGAGGEGPDGHVVGSAQQRADASPVQARLGRLERAAAGSWPVQRLRDLAIPEAGICGPAALLGVLRSLGVNVTTVADIAAVLTGDPAATGSVIGEIFTRAQLRRAVEHYGRTVTFRPFGTADELWTALGATGGNPVMVAISNVGFDQLARPMDAELRKAAAEWVRAHWIVVTSRSQVASGEGTAPVRHVTYTEAQNRNTRTVPLELLHAANLRLDAEWDWETWSKAYGRDPAVDPSVGAARVKRTSLEGPVRERLELHGYVAEIA